MSAAALPAGSSKHCGDGALQPLVGIGGYQLHPAEPSSGQRPQDGQPERAVLGGAHVHTQDLTLSFGIDSRRHHHADVDDATALPNLLRQAGTAGGRDAGGNYPRMPGRSPTKRAKLRWRVGAWLVFGIGSAIALAGNPNAGWRPGRQLCLFSGRL